jgi:hypothetical protein
MSSASTMTENRIEFSLPYVEADQVAAMRFYLKLRWLGLEGAKTFAIVAIIMSAITISGPLFRAELTVGLATANVFVGFMLAFATCCICYIWQVVSCSRSVRKAMSQLGLKGEKAHYRLTDSGIEIEDRVMGGSFGWNEIHSWAENHRTLLIYRSEQLFYHFAFDQMEPGDLTAMRAYLTKAQITKR